MPVHIDGSLDSPALQQAIGDVVRKHETLRTCLKDLEGTPVQYVKPLTDVADDIRITAHPTMAAMAAAARHAFDLQSESPIRVHLVRLSRLRHQLLFVLHPAAIDAWSIQFLLQDLYDAYAARRRGEVIVAEPALQYVDYSL